MTILGQLEPGIVRIVKPGNGTEIGFAFTVENGNGGQLQRWMLYEDPQNAFEIRPAPQIMAGWTLSDWKQNVTRGTLRQRWNAKSIYIWAQSNVYLPGNTYNGIAWGNKIPPAASLPQATYPPEGAEYMQLDFKVPKAIEIFQAVRRGLAFTVGSLTDTASVEYWALSSSYQAAGAQQLNAATSISTGTGGAAASLDQFIALANGTWTANSRFVITGCVNYRDPNGPPGVP